MLPPLRTGVCVIGAGPAGLMAAICAASAGAPTTVAEANTQPGRKLLLTGGGRCNFTHVGRPEDIARAFGKAGRFLRHGLHDLSPDMVIEFFHARGLPAEAEPDGCIFPVSNKADDVLGVLVREAEELGVEFLYRLPALDLKITHDGFAVETSRRIVTSARLILATGGVTWPQTGSTGDGLRFAAALGHTVTAPKPSLVPLVTRETWVRELAGVSVPAVKIWAAADKRRTVTGGNMLFTQHGVGGPAVLDLSRFLVDELSQAGCGIDIRIDMAPGLDVHGLDRQLKQKLHTTPKKTVANVLAESMPRQFAWALCRIAQCDGDLRIAHLRADVRRRLVASIKGLPLCVTGTEPIAAATVTHGGVSTAEIDARTMESRILPGLFFAGEVIDVDGPCGGYNLQACWSTGALAGRSATRSL